MMTTMMMRKGKNNNRMLSNHCPKTILMMVLHANDNSNDNNPSGRSYMESEDSAPNGSSNRSYGEMDDYLDEALEDDDGEDDDADDYNCRGQNPAVSIEFNALSRESLPLFIFSFSLPRSEKTWRWRRVDYIEQLLFREETIEHCSPSDNSRRGANGLS